MERLWRAWYCRVTCKRLVVQTGYLHFAFGRTFDAVSFFAYRVCCHNNRYCLQQDIYTHSQDAAKTQDSSEKQPPTRPCLDNGASFSWHRHCWSVPGRDDLLHLRKDYEIIRLRSCDERHASCLHSVPHRIGARWPLDKCICQLRYQKFMVCPPCIIWTWFWFPILAESWFLNIVWFCFLISILHLQALVEPT
jgi:hypothetical protein